MKFSFLIPSLSEKMGKTRIFFYTAVLIYLTRDMCGSALYYIAGVFKLKGAIMQI